MASIEENILTTLKAKGRGSIFFPSDFTAYVEVKAVGKSLERLTAKGDIIRLDFAEIVRHTEYLYNFVFVIIIAIVLVVLVVLIFCFFKRTKTSIILLAINIKFLQTYIKIIYVNQM